MEVGEGGRSARERSDTPFAAGSLLSNKDLEAQGGGAARLVRETLVTSPSTPSTPGTPLVRVGQWDRFCSSAPREVAVAGKLSERLS